MNNVTEFNSIINDLTIRNNDLLTDISALGNMTLLSSNQYFVTNVSDNPLLESLNGLQVANSGYYLVISNNDSLINLEGLGDVLVEEIFINNNDLLQSLDGLTGNVPIQIYIENNPILNSILAMESLNFDPLLYPLLSIRNNPNLTFCNIIPFCTSIFSYYSESVSNPSYVIENNASGCNSIVEIAYNCGLIPSNDECNDAIPLTLGETMVAYNEFSTMSAQVPSCNNVNRADVWFTFNSGLFTSIDILVESGFNLQLWEGDCTNLTQVSNACAELSLNDITVIASTDYYVQVWSDINGNGRRATGLFSIIIQDATLSTQNLDFNEVTIFPNPVNNELNINANSAIVLINVYNLLGQNIMQTIPNEVQTKLNMSLLQEGIYIIKIKTDIHEVTYKVIKD